MTDEEVAPGEPDEGGSPMTVGIECYIELAGITVEPTLLGQSVTMKRDRWAYRIDLPEAPNSFNFKRVGMPNGPLDERAYEPSLCYVGDPDRGFVEVRIVRVIVNATYDFTGTYDRSNPEHEIWAEQIFHEVRRRALDAARDFTDLVRLRGQFTIEPTGQFPRVLNLASLVRLESGMATSFGWSIANGGTIRIIGDDEILDQPNLEIIQSELRGQRGAWVGELLVGEAMYLVESHQRSGPAQATLLAAMGVEVHTKDVLRHLADKRQGPVLELLLANPRDWSMAAHGLFVKGVPTIAGEKLGTPPKQLGIAVQRLFTARNAVAHKGEPIELEDAKGHVGTARDAIAFLRSLVRHRDDRSST